MILQTNLKHVETAEQYDALLREHENVMICCGRMGPMCIPVYQAMIELESSHPRIAFRDIAFDTPDAHVIRGLPEYRGFMGLPFTVYCKHGKVVEATSGLQSKEQVADILDRLFA
ncbi:MAG: thioredoxin [Bacteroidales bacterium]